MFSNKKNVESEINLNEIFAYNVSLKFGTQHFPVNSYFLLRKDDFLKAEQIAMSYNLYSLALTVALAKEA